MSKSLSKRKNSGQVDEKTISRVEETENYSLDQEMDLEKNADLIKYEFNTIELPFFTKDKNIGDGVIRRYIFSEKENKYMRVIPDNDPTKISNKIPQEFDEKIFYGILRLAKEQKRQAVITDYFTLASVSNVPYSKFERIKDAIERLRDCRYEFNNIFYEADKREIKRGTLFSINILSSALIITFEKMQDVNELTQAERDLYRPYFRNKKISEILVLTLAPEIYRNLENKHGFLYINYNTLLDIDNPTTRKLYVLITKWHGWENKNKIRRSCRFIASRLPLSWEDANISKSISYIEASAAFLKETNLIFDYVLTKTKPLTDSYIDFYFGKETSPLIEYNKRAASITTGQENIVIDSVDDFLEDDRQATIFDIAAAAADVENLLLEVPEAERTESIKRLLEKFVSNGVEYVKSNILYTNANRPENYPGYLARALADDYAATEREKAELKAKQEREKKEREAAAAAAEKARKEELQRRAVEKYESMTEEEKAAFHAELQKEISFKYAIDFFQGDISRMAIVRIASNLEKEELQK